MQLRERVEKKNRELTDECACVKCRNDDLSGEGTFSSVRVAFGLQPNIISFLPFPYNPS